MSTMLLLVRTRLAPLALIPAIRTAVRRADPLLAPYDTMTIDEMLAMRTASPRLYGLVSAATAAIALLLAGIGLYGLLAYSVGRRTREFGIQMAIGADAHRVTRDVVGAAMKMTAAGVAVGMLGAWLAGSFLQTLLFDVVPHDLGSMLAVVGMFVAVAVAAAYVPARRATRVDPSIALRG